MSTSAGANEELAVAVVDIARRASAEHDRDLATKADSASLKGRSDVPSRGRDSRDGRDWRHSEIRRLTIGLLPTAVRAVS